jgi:hypothetical protein
MNLEFSQQIFRNTKISSLMKIHPVEPNCSMQVDEQTDRQTGTHDKAFTFHNFANAPKNWSLL